MRAPGLAVSPALALALGVTVTVTDARADRTTGPARGTDGPGAAAARLVASERGYRTVIRELRAWHGTRHNGCAAFVATALGHVGFRVPDERPDGPWSNPARVTFSLDGYLAAHGWARVDDPAALRAGDVVFTAGAPDHVMLFHGWADRAARMARVSDNQRRTYRRPLAPAAGSDLAAFGFARRAPAPTPAEAAPARAD